MKIEVKNPIHIEKGECPVKVVAWSHYCDTGYHCKAIQMQETVRVIEINTGREYNYPIYGYTGYIPMRERGFPV
jgi:hypothetical protein